uniref:translation initiation factor IF-2-like n=1 Tax=Halichoerus grypus TaxID=9711 RepID=UPI001659DD5C|nr:translation initiation factor IF-2-like [Halichoerus grypus]
MTVYAEFQGVHKASRSLEGLPVNSSAASGRDGGLGSPTLEPTVRPGARPLRAALRGGENGGGGGAETEAFPVGERSEAPQEAPGERLLRARCSSRTCLPRPGPAPHPAPRPRPLPQPLWEPRTFGPATPATLRVPNPTRAACRRAAIRAGRTGRSPETVGGPGGASVGSWEEGTPRPPLQARPRLLFSLLGTSYRRFSDELRPAPGVDRTVPLWWLLGVPGRDRTLMDPLHLQLSQLRRNLDSGGHTKNASLAPV